VKKSKNNPTPELGGAHLLVVVFLVAVVALVGFAFWRIQQDQEPDTTTQTATVEPTEEIRTMDDLDAAEATLESTDIDEELDTEELDAVIE
jgi:hypothetical protein